MKTTTILTALAAMFALSAVADAGRIAATDTPENLTSQIGGSDMVELAVKSSNGEPVQLQEILSRIPNVLRVELAAEKEAGILRASVEVQGTEDLRPAIARCVIENGLDLIELSRKRLTLEEIFLELTTEEDSTPVEEVAESASTESDASPQEGVR